MARKSRDIPDSASARRILTMTLQNLWLAQRANSYRVAHRGPINWASFNFDESPRAVAILLDDCGLFRNRKGVIEATLSFEIFAKLKEVPDEIDDGLMDEFYEDVNGVLIKLRTLVSEAGYPIIARIEQETATAIETHDAVRGVQGLVATMRIDF